MSCISFPTFPRISFQHGPHPIPPWSPAHRSFSSTTGTPEGNSQLSVVVPSLLCSTRFLLLHVIKREAGGAWHIANHFPFICVMFYNQGLPSLEQMVHCQIQVALLSVPSRLPFAIVLLQPSLLRLAGFIHHSGQVYTPRPKARTANKLP